MDVILKIKPWISVVYQTRRLCVFLQLSLCLLCIMCAWMKDYSVANYFLFQMNPKLVLIINMQYYINFHGNKLGPAGDFLLQKRK